MMNIHVLITIFFSMTNTILHLNNYKKHFIIIIINIKSCHRILIE